MTASDPARLNCRLILLSVGKADWYRRYDHSAGPDHEVWKLVPGRALISWSSMSICTHLFVDVLIVSPGKL
jgi:hypothetical protein